MTIHKSNLSVLLLFSVVFFSLGASLPNCPQTQIKFEKLIGIKPSSQQTSNLLYTSKNHIPVTLDCIKKCANDSKCTSFLLYYNSSTCYSFANETLSTQNYDYDSKPDTNVVWFRKICLNAPDSCKTKLWAVEILAGATLVGHKTQKINNRITRQRCIESCIEETSFLCKSVKFNIMPKYTDMTDPNPVGICVLSDTDRHLTPNAFRVSRYEDEYIENQCVNTTNSTEYCAYEEYDNTVLEHTDLLLSNITQQKCQETCDNSVEFNCRGYSIIPLNNLPVQKNPNLQYYTCLLHSEDSKLIGPKLLINYQGAKYYERARCLNVSVTCTSNLMSINYQPEQQFSGRIYTSGYSETSPCYSDGHDNATVQLNIPLNRSVCGIVEAHTNPSNRTLKSALLVIQYNALIQTQADRLIKVGCVYGNDEPDPEITVSTSVNFTNSFPNRGSTVMNTSSVMPNVTMSIVDFNSKKPTTDTEIGQELQMIIKITPGDGPYDIWANNLVATSGNNTLQLLDARGCPTSLNIFSRFTRIQMNSSILLVSTFQAFKFPSTPLVRFSIMVHFCTMKCPDMQCINNEENENRVRRNTNFEPKEQLTEINATIYKNNGVKNPNDTEEMLEEMPLDIILYVKGMNIASDQLQFYAENSRILIAEYGIYIYVNHKKDVIVIGESEEQLKRMFVSINEVDKDDAVCLDYTLFVGLLVTWVLLQVIIVVCCCLLIRKYKKYFHIEYTRQLDDMHQNFGFGHRDFSRRVHWADQ